MAATPTGTDTTEGTEGTETAETTGGEGAEPSGGSFSIATGRAVLPGSDFAVL
ncbi:MAG: hypothetical protein WKF73_19285 [Nocardioidaceae bacterium]